LNKRKLFAFFGVVPLGAFVFVHVITTSTAMSGAARFDRVFARTPVLTSFTMLVVMAPLVAHAVWGLLAAREPRSLHLSAWLPGLRRWSAIVLLAFLVAHIIELPLRGWLGSLSSDAMFDVMSAHMSSTWHALPLVALGYLVGTAATLFHLATALWASFRVSGVLVADRTSALLKWGIIATSAVLFVIAGATIVYLATGTRLLYPAPAFVPDGPPSSCSPKS
jgi:succinate dehydrogenase / fumarate reductase cytochrome b subunit